MSEARAYTPTVTRVKTVRVIPPTIQPLSDIPAFSAHPRRVAAYARVSTSSEEHSRPLGGALGAVHTAYAADS